VAASNGINTIYNVHFELHFYRPPWLRGTLLDEFNKVQFQLPLVTIQIAKFFHIRHQALGPELIQCTGSQTTGDFLSHSMAVGYRYFPIGLWSPCQLKNVTIL